MEDTLCNISAFRYHRVPPHVLGLLPPVPSIEVDRRRLAFMAHPLIQEVTKTPVHLLSKTRADRSSASAVKAHLAKHDAPFGSIIETSLEIRVSSPLYCLFQLAQMFSEIHLLMAMYEFCGSFTIYRPGPWVTQALAQASPGSLAPSQGWRCATKPDGTPTDLWSRPPLVAIEELQGFAKALEGARGSARFARAAKLVTGITASPFEAQLSILLSLPRRKGGEGMPCFENNARISLSGSARKIAGQSCCYADLLFEKTGNKQPLVVECQGKVVHDNYASTISDSDRTTALKQMGYNVIPLTYSQIANARQFDVVRKLIAREAGVYLREKSEKEQAAEQELRRNLFIDWETLGF